MLGSADDAEDLVQETYLRAWRSYEGYEGRASPRTWLHGIAASTCLTALEGRGRRPRPTPGPAGREARPRSRCGAPRRTSPGSSRCPAHASIRRPAASGARVRRPADRPRSRPGTEATAPAPAPGATTAPAESLVDTLRSLYSRNDHGQGDHKKGCEGGDRGRPRAGG
ncbi:sigma factor [Streptomyces sp. DT193]|uniref:sigma factor n=1 Tax=Streptomyces sp. DT193 TaxID=3393418 RepID=UPI003CF547C2